MSSKDKVLSFLGLAMRAGKVISGFDMVVSSLKRKEVKLLLIAEDISRNTLNKLLDVVSSIDGEAPEAYSFGSSYDLGSAIGKPSRAIIAVTEEGFATKLSSMLSEIDVMEEK